MLPLSGIDETLLLDLLDTTLELASELLTTIALLATDDLLVAGALEATDDLLLLTIAEDLLLESDDLDELVTGALDDALLDEGLLDEVTVPVAL